METRKDKGGVFAVLKLLLGRAKTGKTTAIFRAMGENGRARPQVLIVPEQYSHEAERRLCQTLGNGASAWAEVLSFTRLYNRVLTRTGGLAEPVLDGGGRLLLMHQAVQALSSQLTIYAKPSRRAAFLEHLIATSDELKSYCIPPEQLISTGAAADSPDGQRLRELGLLLACYDGLTARQASDPRDRLTRLADRLKGCDYGRDRDFYLDSFTDFTPQQRQVITQLIRQAHSVTVALTCDGLEGDAQVFAPARWTAQALLADAREVRVPVTFETLTGRRDGAPEGLCVLEQNLFAEQKAPASRDCDGVRLLQADAPYQEVEQAAREICRLVREEGLRYRDIVVAARTMETYGELLEPVFGRYGIPLFYGRRENILDKPILTLLTAALDTVGDGYEYDSLFRYLKTGLTGVAQADVDRLENYVLRWELRGSQWSRQADWSWHPEGYGMKWSDGDRALVRELDQLRRQIIAPLEQLRKTPAGTGSQLVRSVYRFLEEIQLPQRLQERAEQLRERGNLRQAEEYRQLWGILCGAMEQCADLLTEGTMELREFADLFALMLSQYDVGTIPVSLDRVAAGEIPGVAHREAKVLFLLGADEDHFPLITQPPGLLTEGDRELLREQGLELTPSPDRRLNRELTMAYDAVALPGRRLYLSWPRNREGSQVRPAAFVERVKELLSVRVTEPETGSCPPAPLPALDWAGRAGADDLLAALEQTPEWSMRARRVTAAKQYQRGGLTRSAVDALYGEKVRLSASKMDTIKSCHFSYFMQYGLKARARKRAGFDAPEVGTFVHYVLEHVLKEAREAGGVKTLARPEIKKRTDCAVERYVREELGGLEDQTPRFRYLFRRLCQSVDLIVDNVAEELRRSEFQPISFELGFGERGALPPVELTVDGVTLSISGIVDRVDGWEQDGRLYLRVVDYKTGKKSFSLTDVWHGLEMQMLLYLFTLEGSGKAIYGADPVAAGVLYLPARDLILSGSRKITPAQRQKEVDRQLRRSGMLLNDPALLAAMEQVEPGGGPRFLPVRVSKRTGAITGESLATAEQWGVLHRHVEKILRDIAGEIATGNIDADPYLRAGNRSYCDFCDYAAACHFEEGSGRDCHRYLYSVKGKRFWEEAGANVTEKERGGP